MGASMWTACPQVWMIEALEYHNFLDANVVFRLGAFRLGHSKVPSSHPRGKSKRPSHYMLRKGQVKPACECLTVWFLRIDVDKESFFSERNYLDHKKGWKYCSVASYLFRDVNI